MTTETRNLPALREETPSTAPATPAAEVQTSRASLIDRTLARLRSIAGGARLPFVGGDNPDLPDEEAAKLREQMRACLEARGGEVLARAQAANIAQIYLGLSGEGRRRFFEVLAHEFAVDDGKVADAMTAYHAATTAGQRLQAQAALRHVLVAPYVELLTQFNALPAGIKFLVDMRADLMRHVRNDPFIAALDGNFRDLLASWFDVGFLRLERITWDSPAALLDKLIAYEAVHEIRSWEDLRHRLHRSRRCYAYFHPSMPGEPLIFVQVALVEGIAGSVQRLLDPQVSDPQPEEADTAIFYSISNAQSGLRGISFGNFLIKRVVDHISRDLPNVKTFATLSPMPGFKVWLAGQLESAAPRDVLTEDEERKLGEHAARLGREASLASLLDQPGWHADEKLVEALQEPLLKAAARYLLARRSDGKPLDPVARFHLGNGARIERVNIQADLSRQGLSNSLGVMVNYLYHRDEIERNHEAFAQDNVVTVSGDISDLLKGQAVLKDKKVRVSRTRGALGRMIGLS
ncbi:malonyl-CoA decarboxylase [Marinivivus vitaminiproducens]|uniref:malonyl-CoA decarboxylase n=1 Tax=Marinivivus vitaminiproducens TaxID=3035935 RepID=UPI0027A8F209|nr:malonyl-CoA decarboxylase [Geminicoccaceae bacterium SCSIO 64248]